MIEQIKTWIGWNAFDVSNELRNITMYELSEYSTWIKHEEWKFLNRFKEIIL